MEGSKGGETEDEGSKLRTVGETGQRATAKGSEGGRGLFHTGHRWTAEGASIRRRGRRGRTPTQCLRTVSLPRPPSRAPPPQAPPPCWERRGATGAAGHGWGFGRARGGGRGGRGGGGEGGEGNGEGRGGEGHWGGGEGRERGKGGEGERGGGSGEARMNPHAPLPLVHSREALACARGSAGRVPKG